MATRYFVSALALVTAGFCSAQLTPGSDAYQAWKLSQIQYPLAVVHPPAAHMHGDGQRDDEPCACWIEPDSTYTIALPANDDGSSSEITLPFTFNLYGDNYTTCYINNNGNITFDSPYGTFSPIPFPNTTYIMVSPFWGDVDTRADSGTTGGTVMYRLTPHALFVNWSAVGYFPSMTDKLNTFQLIISDGTDPAVPGGNNVSFCYGTMQWTTGAASGGIDGFGGSPATVGANRGDGVNYLQLGQFDHDGTDWDGPFDGPDGVAWLTDRHYSFNTSDETIPPIFISIGCDTIDIDAGTSSEYPMMVLVGGPGQEVTATSQCQTLANYAATITNFVNGLQIMSTIAPTASEVGIHAITYTAVTNDPVPLTATYTVYVKVLEASSGIQGLASSGTLAIQPNPVMDRATITWPAGQQPTRVEVFSMNGSVVLAQIPEAGATQMELDLRGLPDGIYTVRATSAASTSTVRLVRSSAN
ncbi:MAG: nidogen-like domain-containing protein [Flavobacteriales bacterium]